MTTKLPLEDVIARFAEYADDAFLIAEAEPLAHPGPRIVWCNDAFERMTGFTRAEIIGSTPRILQGPETDPQARANIRQALHDWRSVRQDILNYRKDGTPFWVELIIRPVADASGRFVYWAAVQRNITASKARELELAAAKTRLEAEVAVRAEAEARAEHHAAELENTNAELARFANVAAHDLQAPLRKIRSFVQLLTDDYGDSFDEDGHRHAAYLLESTERLQHVVADLLRYSRVGGAGPLTRVRPVDLNDVVAVATSEHAEPLKAADGAVRIGALPQILGDRALMVQVFENLIGNALKYRSDRPLVIDIAAQAQTMPDGRAGWRVSVADTGIGFAPEDAERIFRAFERLHRRDEYPGSGLGLATSRRIIARHGGRISAAPRPEGGAVFHVDLPADGPKQEERQEKG